MKEACACGGSVICGAVSDGGNASAFSTCFSCFYIYDSILLERAFAPPPSPDSASAGRCCQHTLWLLGDKGRGAGRGRYSGLLPLIWRRRPGSAQAAHRCVSCVCQCAKPLVEFPLDLCVNCLIGLEVWTGWSPAGRMEAKLDIKEFRNVFHCSSRTFCLPLAWALMGITGSTGIFPLLSSICTLWRLMPDQLHSIIVLLGQNQS